MKKLKPWQIILLIVFYPVGIIYLIYWIFKKITTKKIVAPVETASPIGSSPISTGRSLSAEAKNILSLHIDSNIGKFRIKYRYPNIRISGVEYAQPDFSLLKIGSRVEFVPEPENQYDKNAILILNEGQKLGYMPKGNLQLMILDFLRRKEPICGVITKYDYESSLIELYIVFYKDPLEGLENCETIKAKLTKTSKKDEFGGNRQDSFIGLNGNDLLNLEYVDETETYLVSDEVGNELGELSKAISAKLQEKENEYETIAMVDEVNEDDDGKYSASILIFLK